MKLSRRSVALFSAVLVLLAGCGSGTDADAEFLSAIQASMNEDIDTFEGIDFDPECAAESFVDAVGGAAQAEEKYGLTVEVVETTSDFDIDLQQADAEAFVDGFWECGDILAAMADGMIDEGASEEDATCLAENMDDEPFKVGLVAEFMGDEGADLSAASSEQLFGSIMEAMGTCGLGLDSFGE